MSEDSGIIELVGVPGSGKSYIMNHYAEKYDNSIEVVDFGKKLQKRMKSDGYEPDSVKSHVTRNYVKDLLSEMKNDDENYMMTSHVVHYDNGEFNVADEIEKFTNPEGYIYVHAPLEKIYERVLDDIVKSKRNRELLREDEYYRLMYHTYLNTYRLAHDMESGFLVVNNDGKRTDGLLDEVDEFINECLEDI